MDGVIEICHGGRMGLRTFIDADRRGIDKILYDGAETVHRGVKWTIVIVTVVVFAMERSPGDLWGSKEP
jgi:hypothetical protein